jgi:hypothetical protein
VVKSIRNSSITRLLVVAAMLFSWLVVTNHCALAQLQTGNAEHVHCHAAKGDSGKKTPADGMRECCRLIKANLAGKAEIKLDLSLLDLRSSTFLQVLYAPAINSVTEFVHDHGPPRSISFAEIVLQRSLLNHAPPALV